MFRPISNKYPKVNRFSKILHLYVSNNELKTFLMVENLAVVFEHYKF